MKTLLSALAPCLLLAACESTSFQAPPVAETACDPALPGVWESVGDDGKNGEVEMRVDAACRMHLLELKQGQMRDGEPTQLHVGSDGEARYFWVDGVWASKRFELDTVPPAGDVYLLRYRIDGDRLRLEMPDSRAIAHRIIDNRLRGEVHRDEKVLANRLLAPVDPAALREPGFFDKDVTEMRRRPGAEP